MTPGDSYLVAGTKPWNRRIFEEVIASFPGKWHFAGGPDELVPEKVAAIGPRYVFFLHWSWKVPDEIFNRYECVCFHMTDVPYGRGGSPLQNLILRGHQRTKLTALRMAKDFDAGPVYLKEDLSLEGTAEEIYVRATYLSAKMIRRLIEEPIEPVPQAGEGVVFKRRQPHESRIPELPDLKAVYDFIRMLDADTYPPAFVEHGGFRFEFSRAALHDRHVKAEVRITPTGPRSA